jgi:hypothetical protein
LIGLLKLCVPSPIFALEAIIRREEFFLLVFFFEFCSGVQKDKCGGI